MYKRGYPFRVAERPLWWNGPDWVSKDFSDRPNMKIANKPTEMPEVKSSKTKDQAILCMNLLTCGSQNEVTLMPKTKDVKVHDECRLDPKRFSSWTHLVGIHARVRRVMYNMKNKENKQTSAVLLPE